MVRGFFAKLVVLLFVSGASSAKADEDAEFGVLFVAPGVEETYYTCSACHSERIIAQQGLILEDWEEVFQLMVDEHGMTEIEDPDRSVILEYLTNHYNRDRPHLPISGAAD